MPRSADTPYNNATQHGYNYYRQQQQQQQHGQDIETIKNIAELQPTSRRFNDYTTIPRQSRERPRVRQTRDPEYRDSAPQRGNDATSESRDDDRLRQGCKQECNDDASIKHRKEKSWGLIRIKNAFRSLKSGSADSKPEKEVVPTFGVDVRPTDLVKECTDAGTSECEDIYADIDSMKDLSHRTSCRVQQSGSSSSMAVTLPAAYGPPPCSGCNRQDTTDSSQRCGMMKTLSSLSIRSMNTRKMNSKKTKYEPPSKYGSSFRESVLITGQRLANNDCKRCRSFTISTSGRCAADKPPTSGKDEDDGFYSKQANYESRESALYSLARAEDQPPPLPERTYLKLRDTGSKENARPPGGADPLPERSAAVDRRPMSLPVTSERASTNYKPASYPKTIPQHVNLRSIPSAPRSEHIHQENSKLSTTTTTASSSTVTTTTLSSSSSGYGSTNYYRVDDLREVGPPVPPPVATLPTRNRHRTSRDPCTTSGRYAKRKDDVRQESSSRISSPVVLRRPDVGYGEQYGRHRLTPSVIHNLPLPPGAGGAQLVRTLQLDNILKNRWISGIAVTKKNEYIVVDQREAYLLDEDGSLKKTIGSKGSCRLIEPFDVAVSPSNGNLVICDHAEQDVKIFTWKGQFVKRVNDPTLTNIAGVAVTESRDIVIAGTDKQRLSVISEEGTPLYTIPQAATDSARTKNRPPFEHPYSVAVNPLTCDIIIGDDYKQIVTAVSSGRDGQDIRVLWRYCPGPGDRHFFPSAICADNKGYIFIADLYNEKVYMLDSSGKYVKTLLSRGDGLRGGPGAIATDNRGHLLVADEEKTIKVFKYRDENGFAVTKRYSYCP
ncbi:hypothetical protein LSH36_574g01062 [Paralvinella palmiformis]|uniref:Uncharacterized protein n=1 Tax=Paralvinella palmiformis TaxID=53620 RepID=A0AAD9J6Z7_9ANNE|nr:hypothetical protein LSH36_574g01062 [Paralvinella palmiformis]